MNVCGRVCVIGAQGALGGAVVGEFRSTGWEVLPAGRRADARPGFRLLDLERPETIAPALADVDLVVSAVADSGLAAERVVAERGGLLVNCSHTSTHALTALAAEVGETRGTVLSNAGLVPGVANLLAADLLRRHPEADCLEVAFTVLSSGTAGRAGGEFVHRGLTSRSHHRVLTLPLPEPFGELACLQVGEHQDGSYAGVAGQRRVETYIGFGDRPLNVALRGLNALRLIGLLPRAAFAVRRQDASDPSTESTAVWVGVRSGEKRLGASMIECDGDYRATAAAARIFAERLLDHRPPGCFNPEDLFETDDLAQMLGERGIKMSRSLDVRERGSTGNQRRHV